MWEIINQIILTAQIILFVFGALFVWGRKNALLTFSFLSAVFVLNFTMYMVPAFYVRVVLEENIIMPFYVLDALGVAAKSLIGSGSSGMVEGYATLFPVYVSIYGLSLVLGFLSTSFAAITTFGRKILNVFKLAVLFNSKSCDIVSGNSSDALSYAKSYKKTIIALSRKMDKSVASDLINSGYTVIQRNLCKEFFKSRFFNTKTKYNIIFPNDSNAHYDEINNALSYFKESSKPKNIYFYIETEEGAIGTEKNYIDAIEDKNRQNITLFSSNELIARTFVDENPITKDMPDSFLDEDTSVKDGVKLNMFILGFSNLSREIYKQFIMNNQLSVYKDGEYRAYSINYFIYDKNPNPRSWEINGLWDTIKSLSDNNDAYFPLPDMPYNTEFIEEDTFEFDTIREIVKKIEKDNSFSYVLIDTISIYKNIEIAKKLNLLLDNNKNFRIFIYNNSEISVYDDLTCYGNTASLFTHDVIVNDSLTNLARSINTFYSGSDTWCNLSYFDMNSNIALANNLRLKLNLLGLDYAKEKQDNNQPIDDILKKLGTNQTNYEDYFERSTKNALLAQEHFRWNAYHLLSGYIPMKKIRIIIEKNEESDNIKKVIKNNALKKHACITTYKGIDALSSYLAEEANKISDKKIYAPSDFDYYKYDDLLLRAMPDFFRQNNYSVIKKS